MSSSSLLSSIIIDGMLSWVYIPLHTKTKPLLIHLIWSKVSCQMNSSRSIHLRLFLDFAFIKTNLKANFLAVIEGDIKVFAECLEVEVCQDEVFPCVAFHHHRGNLEKGISNTTSVLIIVWQEFSHYYPVLKTDYISLIHMVMEFQPFRQQYWAPDKLL